MHVLVIGGGVVGIATAYELLCDGHEVTLVEREPELAAAATAANACLISPGHSFAWASPAAPWMLVRSLFGAETAVRVSLRADPQLVRWGLRFLRECTTARAERNTLAKVRLAAYSQERIEATAAAEEIDFALRREGTLYLHRDRRTLAAAAERTGLMAGAGREQRVLDVEQCVELEPSLAAIRERLAGAIYCVDDASGDSQAFALALAERCATRGAEIRTGVVVEALRTDGERVVEAVTSAGTLRADAFVVALGAHSPALARTVGDRLAIYPAKGYVTTFPVRDPAACPQRGGVDEGTLVAWSNLGDRVRLASTARFDGYDTRARAEDFALIDRTAAELFPGALDLTRPERGVGLRPVTPDGPPAIGFGARRNLLYNTGHGHMGWTMSCGSARIAADLLGGRTPALPVEPYAVRW